MGDIICTIPAALELKKRHPGALCFYNCDPDFALIPRMTGVADACTHCREIGWVGYWYRFLLGGFYHFAHRDDSPDTTATKPMYQEFCEQFGLPPAESHPVLTVGDQAMRRVRKRLAEFGLQEKNLILIHCGPTWPVREWPAESWTQLTEGLRRDGFTNLAQIGLTGYLQSQQTQPVRGADRSVDLGDAKTKSIPHVRSLLDAFSLEELIAAISLARLFIGIDSGLLHIAASTRTPSVGIFGMTLPEFRFSGEFRKDFVANRIECAGCEHRRPRLHWITGCPYEIRCMKTLPTSVVLEACLRKLTTQVSHAAPI